MSDLETKAYRMLKEFLSEMEYILNISLETMEKLNLMNLECK